MPLLLLYVDERFPPLVSKDDGQTDRDEDKPPTCTLFYVSPRARRNVRLPHRWYEHERSEAKGFLLLGRSSRSRRIFSKSNFSVLYFYSFLRVPISSFFHGALTKQRGENYEVIVARRRIVRRRIERTKDFLRFLAKRVTLVVLVRNRSKLRYKYPIGRSALVRTESSYYLLDSTREEKSSGTTERPREKATSIRL